MSDRACVNCKHYYPGYETSYCNRLGSKFHPIRGDIPILLDVHSERTPNFVERWINSLLKRDACGVEGKYWEKRNEFVYQLR